MIPDTAELTAIAESVSPIAASQGPTLCLRISRWRDSARHPAKSSQQ